MGGFHLFTLADIPVRISPWYLFLLAFFTFGGNPASGLIYALCITISLLTHELGHAFVARHYKLRPHILLHGFGGLTGHESARNDRQEALIIAAGPGAGLVLGGVCLLVLNYFQIESHGMQLLVTQLMVINFFWSIFNLLPMWPMDGGQLFRIGAGKLFKAPRGERITHIVSLATVGVVAVGSYYLSWLSGPFLLFILAMTAWQNVQALSETSPSTPRRDNPFARELLTHAEAAYAAGNDDEAARLSHQLRSEANVPPQLLARAWAILGVTATRKGNYREALSYLKRAPDMPDVVEATAQCFYQLEMYDALEALVTTRAFSQLPSQTRETILGALRDNLPSRAPT
jgi:stage IV sporulation protein FB